MQLVDVLAADECVLVLVRILAGELQHALRTTSCHDNEPKLRIRLGWNGGTSTSTLQRHRSKSSGTLVVCDIQLRCS